MQIRNGAAVAGDLEIVVRGPEDLGRALAELRRREGLTQQQLAERLGVSRPYLGNVEAGRSSGLLDLVFDTISRLHGEIRITVRKPDDA